MVELSNGVVVTGISGSIGSGNYYRINVPEGQTRLTIMTWGGTGDSHLYVKYGSLPTLDDYQYSSERYGNEDEVVVSNPQSGWWYILLYGYESYSGVIFVANYGDSNQTGSLRVVIEPMEVVEAGAQWRVDGGVWQNSGSTVSGLSVGSHTLEFKDVYGWINLSAEIVKISANQTMSIRRSYTPLDQTGSLRVIIEPLEVLVAGAQWRVDGGVWQDSGVTVSGLSIGSHTVEFKEVTGWIKPSNMDVQIAEGQITQIQGTYVRLVDLMDGEAITDISGNEKSYKYYRINVPSGQIRLLIRTWGA